MEGFFNTCEAGDTDTTIVVRRRKKLTRICFENRIARELIKFHSCGKTMRRFFPIGATAHVPSGMLPELPRDKGPTAVLDCCVAAG